jgi:hypothetical protein
MATEKQIQANRGNAARSTGPRTPEGKAASRRNATKHGLTARQIVLVGEDQDAYEALLSGLFAQYNPQGPLQEQLVRQLAFCLWRLQRVPMLEALVLETAKYGTNPQVSGAQDHYSSLRHFVIEKDAFGKLARHEAQLFKQMQSTVDLLGAPNPAARLGIDRECSQRLDEAAFATREDEQPLSLIARGELPKTDKPAEDTTDDAMRRSLKSPVIRPTPTNDGRHEPPTPAPSGPRPGLASAQGYRTTADGIVLTEPIS